LPAVELVVQGLYAILLGPRLEGLAHGEDPPPLAAQGL
jgi:hypothetical protein